ncbi:MAG TPA: response regulator [Candidatus Angelobacter sp.]
MQEQKSSVLIVDDYEPWRRFITATVQKQPEWQIIGEAPDGLEAVQLSQQRQPHLILLDIGLPKLNGIESARRILKVSPESRILFVSENRSWEIAEEALCAGAGGYLVKSDAGRELLPAMRAVLEGERFVSSSLAKHDVRGAKDEHPARVGSRQGVVEPLRPRNMAIRHEVEFYSDEAAFVTGLARLIASVLKAGHIAILVASVVHRTDVLHKLRADGVDIDSALKDGRCIEIDSVDALARLMVDGRPDPVRCANLIGDVVSTARKQQQTNGSRIVFCGECAPILLTQGNTEGTVQMEHLWDEITRKNDVDTLCTYLWSAFPHNQDTSLFQRICAEHTAVHGRALGYEPA